MRTYDVAYVPNSKPLALMPEVDELDLMTLTKNYLCHKSRGIVANCMSCESKCLYGKKAIELLGLTSKNTDNPIVKMALSQIDSAREEMIAKENEKNKMKETLKRGDWYEECVKQEDQVKWLMDTFNISKTQAKRKIYNYRYLHGLLSKENKMDKTKEAEPAKEPEISEDGFFETMKRKLESLEKDKEEYKKMISKFERLYEQAKDQADALQICIQAFGKE